MTGSEGCCPVNPIIAPEDSHLSAILTSISDQCSDASYRIHSSSAGFLNHSCSVTNTAMAGIYPEPIPKREDIDDLMKSFDTIPLFMQDMPEDDNVAMEALQSLVHDGTPDG